MRSNHGADKRADDWVTQGQRDSEQGPDADVKFVDTALAPGASPSTVAAATEIKFFAADISSLTFDAALADGLIIPAKPPLFSTPAPTAVSVVMLTESSQALLPKNVIRDRRKRGADSYFHGKRPQKKSPSLSLPAANVSSLLPSLRPKSRTLPAQDSSGHL